VVVGDRPVGEAVKRGGHMLGGLFRINLRRLILPATSLPWVSRAVRPPPTGPVSRRADEVLGAAVLELEPRPFPPDDLWWYHGEVLGLDLPANEIRAPEFFAVPPHQMGDPFPPPDRMPPVIVQIRLTMAQFGRWLTLLEATPYPMLRLDAEAATAQLELSDMG
jgi:hypothetical protein